MQPPFIPAPGQMDFTHARWAPVMNCVLLHKGKILLVRRSDEMQLYPGHWNGISGFLDDQKDLRGKAEEEMGEEIGMTPDCIESVELGEIFDQESPDYGKTWVVHPLLVRVNTDRVVLNWEGAEYRWMNIEEAESLVLLPGFSEVLKHVRPLI